MSCCGCRREGKGQNIIRPDSPPAPQLPVSPSFIVLHYPVIKPQKTSYYRLQLLASKYGHKHFGQWNLSLAKSQHAIHARAHQWQYITASLTIHRILTHQSIHYFLKLKISKDLHGLAGTIFLWMVPSK